MQTNTTISEIIDEWVLEKTSSYSVNLERGGVHSFFCQNQINPAGPCAISLHETARPSHVPFVCQNKVNSKNKYIAPARGRTDAFASRRAVCDLSERCTAEHGGSVISVAFFAPCNTCWNMADNRAQPCLRIHMPSQTFQVKHRGLFYDLWCISWNIIRRSHLAVSTT